MFSRIMQSSNRIHSVASKGFNLQTDAYAEARPTYPNQLLEAIKNLLPKGAQVVDLAAGTGIMTKLLVNQGLDVVAIEPVENMRHKLAQVVPGVPCLEGTSWNMPFDSESKDAVIAAQAFHWFDDIKTLQEFHRVLKSDGYGILAWNLESAERSDWVAQLRNTYEGYDKDVPQFRKMTWRKVFETEEAKSLFELPYEYKIFTNDFWMPKENVWRRILSKSYISCLEKEEQEQLKLKVEALLKNVPVDDRNRVFYPHETHLVYFKKRTN